MLGNHPCFLLLFSPSLITPPPPPPTPSPPLTHAHRSFPLRTGSPKVGRPLPHTCGVRAKRAKRACRPRRHGGPPPCFLCSCGFITVLFCCPHLGGVPGPRGNACVSSLLLPCKSPRASVLATACRTLGSEAAVLLPARPSRPDGF